MRLMGTMGMGGGMGGGFGAPAPVADPATAYASQIQQLQVCMGDVGVCCWVLVT
jgi:hypothetical protein